MADLYSDRDLDEAYRLVMATRVTADDFKRIVEDRGYDAQTLFLDDIVVFLLPSKRYEGVFASFDCEAGFPVNESVQQVSGTSTADE